MSDSEPPERRVARQAASPAALAPPEARSWPMESMTVRCRPCSSRVWSKVSPPMSYAGSSTAEEVTSAVPMVRGGRKAHSSSACTVMVRTRSASTSRSLWDDFDTTSRAATPASVSLRLSSASSSEGAVTIRTPMRSMPSIIGSQAVLPSRERCTRSVR